MALLVEQLALLIEQLALLVEQLALLVEQSFNSTQSRGSIPFHAFLVNVDLYFQFKIKQ